MKLGKIFKSAVKLTKVPISIAKDCATLGGTLTDKRGGYTKENLEEIEEALDEITEKDEDN